MTGAEITTIAAAESRAAGPRGRPHDHHRDLAHFDVLCGLRVPHRIGTPWNTVRSGESPFTLALNTMHVPWAPAIMSVIILTAVLSCLNSAFYVSSRVLFILADHGDAPQALVRLNARKVPVISVLIGAVAGFLGIIAATEAPQKVFDFLVSSSGALVVFVYMAIVFAQINLRRKRERAGEPVPQSPCGCIPYFELRRPGRHERGLDCHGRDEGDAGRPEVQLPHAGRDHPGVFHRKTPAPTPRPPRRRPK